MYETKCPENFNLLLSGDITGSSKCRKGIPMVNYKEAILLTM